MKLRLTLSLAALLAAGVTVNTYAQDRTFSARSFLMDDGAGNTYRLQVPSLGGNVTFTFPGSPILPGSLLYGSAANTLSILPGGSPGDILVYSGTSMPAWSSSLSSLHLNALDLGTNGPGGAAGALNIRDGLNPGSQGSLGFSGGNFTTGGAGLTTGNGAVDAGSGAISGGSLNVGSGAISGGSLNVGSGAISGGAFTGTSLSVGSGAISGGAITGTSLSAGTGAITGGSLNVGTGTISGGAISGSSLSVDALSGVVHATAGSFSAGPVTNAELSNSSITLSNGTGVTVTGSPVSLGGTATIAIGQSVATGASPTFAGMTLNGALDMTNHKISNVLDPTSAQDVATKNYVDLNSAGVLIHPSNSTRNTIDPTGNFILLTLKGSASQTENLLNATNNGGTILASISSSGGITGASLNTGAGTIQTTGTVQAATVTVGTAITGAATGKFAGVVPAPSTDHVTINVPSLTANASITVTMESVTGGAIVPFVSTRTATSFTVYFTGTTPADARVNYIVINE